MVIEDHIRALSRISSAIVSDSVLDDVLRLIVNVTAETMEASVCSLMLLSEKKKELIIRATQSVSEEYTKKPTLKLGEGIAGRVALENKPRAIRDVRKDRNYQNREVAAKEGLCSLLSVPMTVKGRVTGVINCYTAAVHEFSDTEIQVLGSIANQAAMAIENMELVRKSSQFQEELETRKVLDRAKGILMRQQGLTEEQAYLNIQKHSMDMRKSLREVSEAIVLYETLGRKK